MLRINDSILRKPEKILLNWLCQKMPKWVTSDMLTFFGLIGATLSFVCFWLSRHSSGFLWLSVLGIVINWFGDSLDGSLARHRKLERPQYGFFLDHMTDTLAMALIAIGVGLSPYAHLVSGLLVLTGYYLTVILSMVICNVTGNLKISYNGVGPTEIRILVIFCIISAIYLPIQTYGFNGFILTIYDIIIVFVTAIIIISCAVEAVKTARHLKNIDPPQR